jgi:hypothetical protein
VRLRIHDLYQRRTESLSGDEEEEIEAALAERWPDLCADVDPEEGDLPDLLAHLDRELLGYAFDLDLSKNQPPPTFPKLGVEDRRETLLVTTPRQQVIQHRAMFDAAQQARQFNRGSVSPATWDLGVRLFGEQHSTARGLTHVVGPFPDGQTRANSYALAGPLASHRGPDGPAATKMHEDFHRVLGQVQAKHGAEARGHLVERLWRAIPKPYRDAAHHLAVTVRGAAGAGHEEALAGLINYANDGRDRDAYHQRAGHDQHERARTNVTLKRALRAVRVAARQADESWLRPVKKSEGAAEGESPGHRRRSKGGPHPGGPQWEWSANGEIARDMHGWAPEVHRAFAAAAFLGGGSAPDLEFARQLLRSHGDPRRAALAAYGLDLCPTNLSALDAVSPFFKAEVDEAPLPSTCRPLVPEADAAAKEVQHALSEGLAKRVQLGGRHSAGSIVAKRRDGSAFLLKPGAGKQSPAAGAGEEAASQSRREAAFWRVARAMGLDPYVPRADLVELDGREAAAIEMLPASWRPASRVAAEDFPRFKLELDRYVKHGVAHRWAALDLVAGNPDRHNQNILVSPEGEFRLIDHGSALAGEGFDPAHDGDSFVPYYLRAGAPDDFHALAPSDRLRWMPTLGAAGDRDLREWLQSVDQEGILRALVEYGVTPGPTLSRLRRVLDLPANASEALNRLWAGA